MNNNPIPIDPNDYAEWLIARKSHRVCRRRGMSVSDVEDIEQALRFHVAQNIADHDPAKACIRTFLDRLIQRRLVSILRHRYAARRSPKREECSLNEFIRDEGGRLSERHESVAAMESTEQRLRDLTRDIADLRERLPSDAHRQFLDALARGGTVNSIGPELGLSRRAAARCFEDLRRAFEDAGLRVYV